MVACMGGPGAGARGVTRSWQGAGEPRFQLATAHLATDRLVMVPRRLPFNPGRAPRETGKGQSPPGRTKPRTPRGIGILSGPRTRAMRWPRIACLPVAEGRYERPRRPRPGDGRSPRLWSRGSISCGGGVVDRRRRAGDRGGGPRVVGLGHERRRPHPGGGGTLLECSSENPAAEHRASGPGFLEQSPRGRNGPRLFQAVVRPTSSRYLAFVRDVRDQPPLPSWVVPRRRRLRLRRRLLSATLRRETWRFQGSASLALRTTQKKGGGGWTSLSRRAGPSRGKSSCRCLCPRTGM
jgi:hypothetical protein